MIIVIKLQFSPNMIWIYTDYEMSRISTYFFEKKKRLFKLKSEPKISTRVNDISTEKKRPLKTVLHTEWMPMRHVASMDEFTVLSLI